MRIAVQGAAGCFSQQAARGLDAAAEMVFCRDFAEVFAAVADGRASRGLVPIENTIAGAIGETRALLERPGWQRLGETELRIEHALLARPGMELEGIEQVLSHPVALAQCQQFLAGHPDWEQVRYFDTAGGVQEVMKDGPRAAIASAQAAEIYGARVLASDIGDRRDNFTRFVLFAGGVG